MKLLREFIQRHRVIAPVTVIALLMAATGGVLSAQAGSKHSHKVKMVYGSKSVTLPANDVQLVSLFCPGGTKVTGFGASTSGAGVGIVLVQDIQGPANGGYAIFENITNSAAKLNGHIACVKKATSKTQAKTAAARSEALKAAHQREQLLAAKY